MKYISVNTLSDFEFHDSYWTLLDMDEKRFSVRVKRLNIHKSASENPYKQDMEIDNAEMVFYDYRIQSLEQSAFCLFDDNGIQCVEKPAVVLCEKDAERYFFNELKQGICLNGLNSNESFHDLRIEMETTGPREVFSAIIDAQRVTVAWDVYAQPAWYEQ